MSDLPTHNPYAPPSADVQAELAAARPENDSIGWALLALPSIGGLLVPVLTLLELSALRSLLGLVVVIGTIVLISKDAPRWGLRGSRFLLGLLFLWVVAFPMYFHTRAKHGAPSRLLLAILSVAIYLVGSFWLVFARL
ncbi:MAG: hypothetical protein ACXVEF_29275 [Polyangiales bacterium]